jgi:hypothetical protein
MSESDDDGSDDGVTELLLDGSPYERIRFERYSVFSQSIPEKLHFQSALLFGLAAVLPIMAAFPAEVQEVLATDQIGTASPKIILLGLLGGATVFVCGVGLAMLAAARLRLEGEMTEELAEMLLSLEEVASLIGLIIGGASIVLTIGYVMLGHVGLRAIEAYVRTVGRDPFVASGFGVSVAEVAVGSFVGAVALFVLAQAINLQFMLRLDEHSL